MNIKVLVTFAIILVVLLAIPATLLAFNLFNIRSYLPFAEGDIEPVDVNITNLTENGFSVTWWTPTKQTEGSIKYGTGGNVSTVVPDDRGSGGNNKFETHHVSVSSLSPDTEYSFSIFVNNKEYKRGGASYYTVKTLPVLSSAPTPNPVTGTVSDAENIKNDAVVYIYLSNGEEDESIVYSTNTSSNGTFAIDVGTIRSFVVSRAFAIGDETQMNLYALARGKLYGTKEVLFTTDAGEISLTETVVSLNFPTPDYVTVEEEPASVEISVTSPEEGEVLASLSRVRGYANPEENLTVDISGMQTITADVVADSSGYYSYDIYETLTDGNYGLTVSSKDSQERIVNLNFQILGEQVGDDARDTSNVDDEYSNSNNTNNNTTYDPTTYESTSNPLPSTGVEDYWGLILATTIIFMSMFYAIVIRKF